jgi:ABC-2 type transport system ATP-binding protein
MVAVENLTHRYGSRTALDGLTFGVARREIYGVLGPNGGGKSTLFAILSTLITPASGQVTVDGVSAIEEPAKVRRRIGVVFQNQSLDRKLTVEENLFMQGALYGLQGAALRARVAESLERAGLEDRRTELVDVLSGGLKRRVEIAKAALHHPAVLLMDEPSAGLDPGARRELWNHIEQLREALETTVLFTTHLLDEAERCDRLLLIHQGRKVAEGPPGELKSRVGGDVVVLEAGDAAWLAEEVSRRFQTSARTDGSAVRVEIPNGHRFIAEAVEAFPGQIRSVALHKPTLEDVFLDETGVRLGS